eukprot:6071007-Pleurochrysis_carterae.AAC.3
MKFRALRTPSSHFRPNYPSFLGYKYWSPIRCSVLGQELPRSRHGADGRRRGGRPRQGPDRPFVERRSCLYASEIVVSTEYHILTERSRQGDI